jgi:hypothetical protein
VPLFVVGRIVLLAGLVVVGLGRGLLVLDAPGVHRLAGTVVLRRDGFTLVAPIGALIAAGVLLTLLPDWLLRR